MKLSGIVHRQSPETFNPNTIPCRPGDLVADLDGSTHAVGLIVQLSPSTRTMVQVTVGGWSVELDHAPGASGHQIVTVTVTNPFGELARTARFVLYLSSADDLVNVATPTVGNTIAVVPSPVTTSHTAAIAGQTGTGPDAGLWIANIEGGPGDLCEAHVFLVATPDQDGGADSWTFPA